MEHSVSSFSSFSSGDFVIGFSKRDNNIWTVEFEVSSYDKARYFSFDKKPDFIFVNNFKLISIEDSNGKSIRKVPNYSVGNTYRFKKDTFKVFFDKNKIEDSNKNSTNFKPRFVKANNINSVFRQTGFALQNNIILTVHFELYHRPANRNCHYFVSKFKIISIEDFEGKSYEKVNNFKLNKMYNLQDRHIQVFLNKTNAMFYNFYNNQKDLSMKYTGRITEYTKFGNISKQYDLENGILNGEFIIFDDSGENKIEHSFFVDGKRHGYTIYNYYSSEGKCLYTIECKFEMGHLVSWNTGYDKNHACEIIHKYRESKSNMLTLINMFFEQTFSMETSYFTLNWTEKRGNIISLHLHIIAPQFSNNPFEFYK